jgi:hypothetical protein
VVEAIMNNHVDANRLGIVGAVVLAAWHAVWIVLQATGQGQRVMDFVFRMHGLKSDVAVEPFDLGMAALLLATTAVTGYVVMSASGLLWNCLTAWTERSRSGVATRA